MMQRPVAFVCHNNGPMITCALSSRSPLREIVLHVMKVIRQSSYCIGGSETQKNGFLFYMYPVDVTFRI